MSEALLIGQALGAGLITGAAAGVVFFGGLAATVRRLKDSTRPTLLFLGSFLARMVFVAAGAFAAARLGEILAVAAYVVGMLAVRTVIVGRARRSHARNA